MSLLLRRPPGREAYPGDIGGLLIPSKKKENSNKKVKSKHYFEPTY
jgi:F0F1-type ATP synthase alpha subunit